MRQNRPSAPRSARATEARERPALPEFRTFVRALEKLEDARSQAPRPAREGTR